jgi:hypothetical protein
MSMLDPEEFRALFDAFLQGALRLESCRGTDMEDERAEREAFLAGELPEVYIWEPDSWTRMIARHVAEHRKLQRVRVVADPLTDYNRYMIYTGRATAELGEDIRYLPQADANRLELPDHDFWVFDSTRLVELRFTADGRALGHDLITEPAVVARHEAWVRRALAAAVPSADYIADDPTRAWPPVRLGAVKGT